LFTVGYDAGYQGTEDKTRALFFTSCSQVFTHGTILYFFKITIHNKKNQNILNTQYNKSLAYHSKRQYIC